MGAVFLHQEDVELFASEMRAQAGRQLQPTRATAHHDNLRFARFCHAARDTTSMAFLAALFRSGWPAIQREPPMSDFRISLDKANTIITATFAKGREAGMKPLSCVVVDAGGHVIAFQRQDGTSFLRLDIARGKAAGALALGVNSRRIGEMAAERPSFIASLGHLAANGLIPVAGGVIVKGPDGLPIGAVGVTGDTSDNDEIAALAGIAAAGLIPL
jgi:uncharacterized protein GlcG (DUF336 family)